MSTNKTIPTEQSVRDFLNTVQEERKRQEAFRLVALMEEITGEPPVMWGPGIVGFGSYHYVYDSGREGDMPLTGFSPRKQNLTLYISTGLSKYDDLLKKLGKHSVGKSCLYIKTLNDVDIEVLSEMIADCYAYFKKKSNQ